MSVAFTRSSSLGGARGYRPAPAAGFNHFTLVATNGQVIASSEHYESHRSCLDGIESVRKNAPDAELEDSSS